MQPRIERVGRRRGRLREVLTAKSAGNFMYLVHVLRDIAGGALTPATIDDIHKLPQGLKRYYQRHWNDMRSADPEHFRAISSPSCACSPPRASPCRPRPAARVDRATSGSSRAGIATALDAMAVKDVLGAWREFLNEDTVDGERRYRVYHASFQDFLADEVGLVAYHETIGESALAKIPGF